MGLVRDHKILIKFGLYKQLVNKIAKFSFIRDYTELFSDKKN